MNEYILTSKNKYVEKVQQMQKDLGAKLEMAEQRLKVFEEQSEFADVLNTYNR
jgi:CHASE3 domain sensor protein